MLKFPYGISDFAKLIEEGYWYVVRTDQLPLIESTGEQLLFLRPRRFGKSGPGIVGLRYAQSNLRGLRYAQSNLRGLSPTYAGYAGSRCYA